MLPEEFRERMRRLLGKEYPEFEACFEAPRCQALRINGLKRRGPEHTGRLPFTLTRVPWAENGFYYEQGEQPGRHPFHEAGAYYIQEPSAMTPGELLGPQPGELILDLCAAPGGKSTQIAAKMCGRGILICNEIHPARARILSGNIERMGIRNAIVTNETPQRLAEIFPSCFDGIMVDAPCSGEGMFRKNEEARGEWSPENIGLCAARQAEILDCAARMLRPGGRLVYSTCTFAPEEDEESVARFVERNPEIVILEAPVLVEGAAPGRPEWAGRPVPGLERTLRLWPHRLKGEGHFAAVLQKRPAEAVSRAGGDDAACAGGVLSSPGGDTAPWGRERGIPEKDCPEYLAFREENLTTQLSGIYLRFGDQLYLAPEGTPSLRGLKVLRPGLHLGCVKKNRFEPSHALALTLGPQDVRHCLELPALGPETVSYLGGGTVPAEGEKGWYLISADGYSIGWGKLSGGVMKNHYPKGLRKYYC